MSHTALIVDDDPCSLTLSRDLLSVFGYITLEAVNGQEALDLARRCSPDLILMDLQLPLLDRLSATRALKADAVTRGIPIIAATAFAMQGDRERALAAGCSGYVTKPIDIHLLIRTVEEQLQPRSNATATH